MNFFFPRFITIPSPAKASLVNVAFTSDTFSPSTVTPPCSMFLLASDLVGASSALNNKDIKSITPSVKSDSSI